MDGGEDLAEKISRDRNLGQLEENCAGMMHDPGADLDQPRLLAHHGPTSDLVRQVGTGQKNAEIAAEPMQLQADLILYHRSVRQPGPLVSDLALLEVLLSGAALILESEQFFGVQGQVGEQDADAGQQLAGATRSWPALSRASPRIQPDSRSRR